ncbi:MAG TPA: adenylyltransferase/cytidyltransferase family protein [Spirochaetia bacterium]|nr:adenylyltransferase/cytidyltransferase family protein [Spirochaetia bacterium]
MQTSPPRPTRGVVIGRFMPPHAGHIYLVDFARNFCDRLTVLVCTLPGEPIPGELRFRWMQQLFPGCDIVHITDEIPEAKKDSPGSTSIWARTIRRYVPTGVDFVFASEDYGKQLAVDLGAAFIAVDPARSVFPVSATEIRKDPIGNWKFIPPPVRPYYLRRICVVSDSALNPTIPQDELARALARECSTLYVTDYARFWLSRSDNAFSADSLDELLRAQAASEAAIAAQANRVLFVESSALQITVRAELHFPQLSKEIHTAADHYFRAQRYDRYLVVPSADKGMSEFLERCVTRISDTGSEAILLHGNPEARLAEAIEVTQALLE